VRTIVALLFLAGVAHAYAPQTPEARAAKFKRASAFAAHRGELEASAKKALLHPKLDRDTAVAAIVTLMDKTNMRVGSEKYAQRPVHEVTLASGRTITQEPSYGASSLRKDQISVHGDTVDVAFQGKSHVAWQRSVKDAGLAKTVKLFLDQEGSDRLFVVPEGPVTERDVRKLFASYGAKAKDLRTVQANALFETELARLDAPTTKLEAEKNLTLAITRVAKQMGHTPAVCRSSYLDPKRIAAYSAGL
jgi:DNA topoisomerase-1